MSYVLSQVVDENPMVLGGVIEFLRISETVNLLTVLSCKPDDGGMRPEKAFVPFSRVLVDQVIATAWGERQDEASTIPISHITCTSYGDREGAITPSLLKAISILASRVPLVMNRRKKKLMETRSDNKDVAITGKIFTVVDNASAEGVVLFKSTVSLCTLQVKASKCSGGAVHHKQHDDHISCSATSLLCCTHCSELLGTCFTCANECPMTDCACERVCGACFEFDDTKDQPEKASELGLGCKGCDFTCVECKDTKAAAFKASCSLSDCHLHQGNTKDTTCIDCVDEGDTFMQCEKCRQVYCHDCTEDHECTDTEDYESREECDKCHKRFHEGDTDIFRCDVCYAVRCLDDAEMIFCSHCFSCHCYTCEMTFCMSCQDGQFCCFSCAKRQFAPGYSGGGGFCKPCYKAGRDLNLYY